jgi:hypothetical protein
MQMAAAVLRLNLQRLMYVDVLNLPCGFEIGKSANEIFK